MDETRTAWCRHCYREGEDWWCSDDGKTALLMSAAYQYCPICGAARPPKEEALMDDQDRVDRLMDEWKLIWGVPTERVPQPGALRNLLLTAFAEIRTEACEETESLRTLLTWAMRKLAAQGLDRHAPDCDYLISVMDVCCCPKQHDCTCGYDLLQSQVALRATAPAKDA